jgi:transposase InsO family protein
MPFKNITVMEQRFEFILLIQSNRKFKFNELCKRYKISRTTGYKWFNRYKEGGIKNLQDKSKRPVNSPNKSRKDIEEYVVNLRGKEPEWGPKKLHRILHNRLGEGTYPFEIVPCKNTIGKMLKRNGLIDLEKSEQSKAWQHFEYEEPNDLWQIDFKGYFSMLNNRSCHPLVILDDHSRFNIGLYACDDQKNLTVKIHLIESFEKYGLPERILSDNGTPWGAGTRDTEGGLRPFSELEKWLIRLNVKLIHGRPYHPQTQGKEERFNKTFKMEVLKHNNFKNTDHCQEYFDKWREKYNCIRPHESLNLDVPAIHYSPSERAYPEIIPPVEYDDSFSIRKVQDKGLISFKGKEFKIGRGFIGDYVGIRPINKDGEYEVVFCNHFLRKITFRNENNFKTKM